MSETVASTIEWAEARKLGLSEPEWAVIKHQLGRNPSRDEVLLHSALSAERVTFKSFHEMLEAFQRSSRSKQIPLSPNIGTFRLSPESLLIAATLSTDLTGRHLAQQSAYIVDTLKAEISALGGICLGYQGLFRLGSLELTSTQNAIKDFTSGLSSYSNCTGTSLLGVDTYFHPFRDLEPSLFVTCLGVVEDKVAAGSDGELNDLLVVITSPEQEELSEVGKLIPNPLYSVSVESAIRSARQEGIIKACTPMTFGGIALAFFKMSQQISLRAHIDVSRLPFVDDNTTKEDALFSEDVGQFLVCISEEDHRQFQQIMRDWNIEISVVGECINDDALQMSWRHKLVIDTPTQFGNRKPPRRSYELVKYPPMLKKKKEPAKNEMDSRQSRKAKVAAEDLWADVLASPNIASPKMLLDAFDIQSGPVPDVHLAQGSARLPTKHLNAFGPFNFSEDAGIQISVGCKTLYMEVDPYMGAVHSVADAMRRAYATGSRPFSAVDNCSFGNPEKYEELVGTSEASRGFGDACRYWELPIIADWIRFSKLADRHSTLPLIGAFIISLNDAVSLAPANEFVTGGDDILLIGKTRAEIEVSEYQSCALKSVGETLPDIDFDLERETGLVLLELISRKLLTSATPLCSGGLAGALASGCLGAGRPLGASIEVHSQENGKLSTIEWLFSESTSRYLLSLPKTNLAEAMRILGERGITIEGRGKVGGKVIKVTGSAQAELSLSTAHSVWHRAHATAVSSI